MRALRAAPPLFIGCAVLVPLECVRLTGRVEAEALGCVASKEAFGVVVCIDGETWAAGRDGTPLSFEACLAEFEGLPEALVEARRARETSR